MLAWCVVCGGASCKIDTRTLTISHARLGRGFPPLLFPSLRLNPHPLYPSCVTHERHNWQRRGESVCEIRKKERETDREERADWKQESQEELRGRLTGRGVIRGGTLPRQRRGFFPLFWLEGLELGSLSEIDLLMTRSSENSIEPRVKAERKRGKHVQEKKPRNPTRFSIRVEQHTHTHTHTHTRTSEFQSSNDCGLVVTRVADEVGFWPNRGASYLIIVARPHVTSRESATRLV